MPPSCAAQRAGDRPRRGWPKPCIATILRCMAIATPDVSARARAAARELAGVGPRTQGRGARGHRLAHRGCSRRHLRGQRARPRRRPGSRHQRGAARPADARRRARRGARRRGALGRPAGRPGRRHGLGLAPAERARRAEGADPARRAAGRLRGAPERDGRCRRARDQERQRLHPARQLERAPHERRADRRGARRASRTPGCPSTASSTSPAAATSSPPSSPT